MYVLRITIRKGKKRADGTFPQERLPNVIRLASGEYFVTKVKNKTVYAMTQPPEPPPLASMGVEGEGSASEMLEVMLKSEVKESIAVYVVRGLRDAMTIV